MIFHSSLLQSCHRWVVKRKSRCWRGRRRCRHRYRQCRGDSRWTSTKIVWRHTNRSSHKTVVTKTASRVIPPAARIRRRRRSTGRPRPLRVALLRLLIPTSSSPGCSQSLCLSLPLFSSTSVCLFHLSFDSGWPAWADFSGTCGCGWQERRKKLIFCTPRSDYPVGFFSDAHFPLPHIMGSLVPFQTTLSPQRMSRFTELLGIEDKWRSRALSASSTTITIIAFFFSYQWKISNDVLKKKRNYGYFDVLGASSGGDGSRESKSPLAISCESCKISISSSPNIYTHTLHISLTHPSLVSMSSAAAAVVVNAPRNVPMTDTARRRSLVILSLGGTLVTLNRVYERYYWLLVWLLESTHSVRTRARCILSAVNQL